MPSQPAWSPDGSAMIVVERDRGVDLLVRVDLATGSAIVNGLPSSPAASARVSTGRTGRVQTEKCVPMRMLEDLTLADKPRRQVIARGKIHRLFSQFSRSWCY